MPSYAEGDNIGVVIDKLPTMLKPILYTQYDKVTKYNLHITYEDSTFKDVEIVQNDKDRPYKFIYKKEGKLISVIGIPKVYEVKDGCPFTDFTNKIMDSEDLLFDVDCSTQFDCTKARFYLKDIRDIIDLAKEPIEDPSDPMEVYPFTMYPIYLHGHSCHNPIHCVVDDELKVTLTSQVTKLGEPLLDDEYSNFTILSVTYPVLVNQELQEVNKVPLVFTEDSLDKEIKVILKYFVKEINHPVFDEFTIIASKKENTEEGEDPDMSREAKTTQDMLYLGDGYKTGLGAELMPGYKEYTLRRKNRK